MRSGAVLFGVLASVATLCRSGSVRAEGVRPPFVWYRSADGCPDGAAFLARLDARGVRAKLAEVGDAIDFVVTLGNGPEGARGLLERQTETRTVAIRRLDGGTCEQVADAIALSLVVANTPRDEPETAAPEPAAAPEAPRISPSETAPRNVPDAAPNLPPRTGRHFFSLGFQGGGLFGVGPEPLIAGSAFVELEFGTRGLLRGATLRAAALEAQSISSGPQSFGIFVGAGRFEACPLRVGSETVHGSPCAAFTLGSIQTAGAGQGGVRDHGVWSAVDLGARLALRVAAPVAIEIQAGAAIPFERYDFVSEKVGTAYRTAPVGAFTLVGAGVRLP